MAKHSSEGNVAWFIAGLTVGFASALLLAPRSGEQTRRSLADAVDKGREFAADKRRQATEFGRELYPQGREFLYEISVPGRTAEAEASAEAVAPEEAQA